jgi:hypothetical protein
VGDSFFGALDAWVNQGILKIYKALFHGNFLISVIDLGVSANKKTCCLLDHGLNLRVYSSIVQLYIHDEIHSQ